MKLLPASICVPAYAEVNGIIDTQTLRKDGVCINFTGIQVGTLDRTGNKHLACSQVITVGDLMQIPGLRTPCVPPHRWEPCLQGLDCRPGNGVRPSGCWRLNLLV